MGGKTSNQFAIGDALSFLKQARKVAPKREVEVRADDFLEIYKKKDQQGLIKQADRCLDCGNPYCEWKCPVHNYIPNWLEITVRRKYIGGCRAVSPDQYIT